LERRRHSNRRGLPASGGQGWETESEVLSLPVNMH
jgi:hypothetical protein